MTKRFVHITVLLSTVLAVLALVPALAAADANLVNWALGAPYTSSIEASDNYPDEGGQLTDGVYANAFYGNKGWVGYLREDFRVITVDLGEVRPIEEIRANFLQDATVSIRLPVEVIAEVSADGKQWYEVGFEAFDPESMELTKGFTKRVSFDDFEFDGQFVRLIIRVDIWMFIDEIEVLGPAQ